MAGFEVANSVVIKPDGSNGGDIISANGTTTIYRSGVQNTGNNTTLRMLVEYEAVFEHVDASYGLKASIETKGNNISKWTPLILQNNGISNNNHGSVKRVEFEINPQVFDQTFGGTLDQGDTQIQFRQGKPADDWRVCIHLDENRFGQSGAFTQATVSIYGDISA